MSDADGVREVVRSFVEAMNRGEGEAAAGMYSDTDDALAIGTDPGEWFEGAASVREVFTQAQGQGDGPTVRIDESTAGAEGDVGWYAGRGTFVLPDGSERPFRSTGVCRREGGEWKILQSHTSFGVANDEVFGG